MYIFEYMTQNPKTISPDTLLPEAKALMTEFKFRHLPVVDGKGLLIGIVTDRDLRSAYPSTVAKGKELTLSHDQVQNTKISEIMITECVYISPNDTLDDTLLVFDKIRVGALPVIDKDRKVLGMFSIRDLTGAYKKLFGMSEKGSILVAIKDEGRINCMSSIVLLLEEQGVPFTRLIRIPACGDEGGRIYLRINTFKIAKVHKLLQEAGFTLIKPDQF